MATRKFEEYSGLLLPAGFREFQLAVQVLSGEHIPI
jgi:hypothetical protein